MKNYSFDIKPDPMKYFTIIACALLCLFQQDTLRAQCSPDTTPPVAVCDLGLTAQLDSNGELTVWGQDFDDGSYDQCSAIDYFIEEGLPPSSVPPNTHSLGFDTSGVGLHDIVLWVVDSSGNWNYCLTQLEITACTNSANLTCNAQVNVTLPQSGTMEITPGMILEGGPYCNPLLLDFDPPVFTPPGGAGIPVDTSDIGSHIVTVWDESTGNSCWGNLTIQAYSAGGCSNDIVPPTCLAPADISISTVSYDALNIDPNDENQLATHFGYPEADDNCGVQDILKSVALEDGGLCGLLSITRAFVALDSTGNLSQPCEQVIDIYQEWTVHLPTDHHPGDPSTDSLTIIDEGGGLVAVTYEDTVFDFDCDGDGDKVVRKWTTINWCTVGNDVEILELPSLDLNSDGETGDAYDVVIGPDSVYLLENNIPTTNLGAYSNGISYVQVLQYNYKDTLSFTVAGTVFHDGDEDCLMGNGNSEPVLQGWPVSATGLVSGKTYSTFTDSFGQYSLMVCTSDTLVEVSLSVPFNYGQTCPTTHTVQFSPGFSQTVVQDVPVHFDTECPLLWVDISAPFLRRCFENYYTVQYCNYSNDTIGDVHVEVQLDPFMGFVSSGLPGINLGGNLYSFEIGEVTPGECGNFKIYFDLDCDAELGATHCVNAHIFPDTLCPTSINWTGANIEMSGYCENDSIHLSIENTGDAAMSAPLKYIVVEDVIMFESNPFDLGPGEVYELDPISANGSTWRLESPQEPGHPYGGIVAVAVEGCGGINIFGLVNQFPMENANPFIAVDCQQNIGSFDPNDKLAFPAGYGEEHFLDRNTDIHYLVRFQNTGTDTAFQVMVLDELDPNLEPASVRPGASSHPYQFELIDGNVLRFTFNNIALPDSSDNEVASHGFVKFKASQKTGLPLGTKIENRAEIYFDFNDPVVTNTVFHTIGEHFIEIVNDAGERPVGLGELLAFPNPSFREVTFEIPGKELAVATFDLCNALGEQVIDEKFNSNVYQFKKGDLPAGIYFYKIEVEGLGVYTGKIVLK